MKSNRTASDVIMTDADWRVLDSLKVRNLQHLRGLNADLEKDIIREISDGINAGEGMPDLSARISSVTNIAKTRADTIARTETINACIDGARQRYQQLGIEEVEVIACDDSRTCPICTTHDGKIYKLSDDANLPPYHPNCRCAIKAVVKKRDKKEELEKLKRRAEKRVPKVEPNITSVNADRQIPDFSQMKTMSEIEDGLRATFGKDVTIGEGFSALNPETVAPGLARIEPVLHDFRGIEALVTDFGANCRGYASTLPDFFNNRLSLSLNKIYYGCTGKVREQYYAEYLKSTINRIEPDGTLYIRLHPAGTIFDDNPTHEMGHVVEYAIIIKKYQSPWQRIIAWNDCDVAELICKTAKKELEKETGRRLPAFDRIRLDLCRYALKTYSETMAEAFADYYSNKEKAKAISKKIVEVSIQKYNEVYT